MSETKDVFEKLFAVNVNEHVEKKDTGKVKLSYLSWPFAMAEVLKRYPDATWEIKFFDGKPYTFDPATGYMVFTSVTINGITRQMWLPVMDSHNEAMLDKPRQVKTKYNTFTVDAATSFDINKTIMRCLTKNFAAFGLGLYIYAGEDLPIDDDIQEQKSEKPKPSNVNPPPKPAEKKTPVSATSSPTVTPTDDPETAKAIQTVQSYIASGKITKGLTKVEAYIAEKDLEGLKRVINYTQEQLAAEAAFDGATA